MDNSKLIHLFFCKWTNIRRHLNKVILPCSKVRQDYQIRPHPKSFHVKGNISTGWSLILNVDLGSSLTPKSAAINHTATQLSHWQHPLDLKLQSCIWSFCIQLPVIRGNQPL